MICAHFSIALRHPNGNSGPWWEPIAEIFTIRRDTRGRYLDLLLTYKSQILWSHRNKLGLPLGFECTYLAWRPDGVKAIVCIYQHVVQTVGRTGLKDRTHSAPRAEGAMWTAVVGIFNTQAQCPVQKEPGQNCSELHLPGSSATHPPRTPTDHLIQSSVTPGRCHGILQVFAVGSIISAMIPSECLNT